jgi:hypothetical protein
VTELGEVSRFVDIVAAEQPASSIARGLQLMRAF